MLKLTHFITPKKLNNTPYYAEDMFVVSGSASRSVATHLARELSADLADTEVRRFIDGECYVRIRSNLENEDVIIVQTTYPDENIIETILIRDAVRDFNPDKIILVIPYYGYARQDRKFQDGEAVSARAIAEILSIDIDTVLLVDPHKDYITEFFKTKALACSAVPEIAKYLMDKNVDVVLAPDKGATWRAKKAAEILNCKWDFLEKTRITDEIVEIKPKNVDVSNRVIAIIDDIISTGGTMAKAVSEIKRQGAKEIYVACTHGLFVGEAIDKITAAGATEIISTDTIENSFSKVRVAPQIASVLRDSIFKLNCI